MPSLRHDEALERSSVLRDVSYRAHVDLRGGGPTFTSSTTITFGARDGASTFVDVQPDSLTAATLNGVALDVSGFDAAAGRLPLSGLRASNELLVEAVMAYSHDGEGLVRHVDPADGRTYLYAMSFLDAAPRWFACFDQPDLKAPFSLEVDCPPDWTVAGNGPAVRVAAGRWTLEQARPVATYLTTLVAGPYHSVRGSHDGIPLVLHARASLAPYLDRDADALLAHTAGCLDEFHRLFGARYPWGEYHQAFVPDFNAGAMENPGCVTFRDELMFRSRATDAELVDRDNTVAHEMAHMWFGDLVTMRWWDDLWLNESFAEYLGHRVCAALGEQRTWVSFAIERKAWGYAADRRPSTHPVAGNGAPDAASALQAFDGISYAKGASVLRQLAARLGDEVFLGGLHAYIEQFSFGNAELADLLAAWREAGATDIDAWAAAWLRTSGLDTLRAGDGVVHRSPSAREHAVEVASYDGAGALVGRRPVVVTGDRTPAETVPAALVLPDSTDVTWARTAFDDATWAAMPGLLPRLPPVERAVVWNALQLAVADAELDPAVALDVVAAAVPSEDVDSVLRAVLAWAVGTLAGPYGADPGAVARAADLALAAAAPATGRQLAAARGAIAAGADVHRLQQWLAGDVPGGLAVDHDLRWRITARLTVLGACGADGIAAELADDDSSEGATNAALCRALLPDPAAKAAAWDALMRDPDCANSTLYATARGFWHPSQTALTAPYVERYFAEIAATAELRSGWVVSRTAGLAYPSTAVSASTVELTERFLARDDLPSGVRRAVVDQGDDLRRAVASRARFAGRAQR